MDRIAVKASNSVPLRGFMRVSRFSHMAEEGYDGMQSIF